MTILAIDGFELEKTSASFLRRYPLSVNVPATWPDVSGRLGGKCLKADGPLANPLIYIDHADSASGIYTSGIGIYIDDLDDLDSFNLYDIYNAGSQKVFSLIIKKLIGDTGFRIESTRYSAVTPVTEADTTYDLDFQTWHYIEFQVTLKSGETGLILKVNDDTDTNVTGVDSNVFSGYDRTEINLDPSPTSFIYIDDLYICDATPGFIGSRAQIEGLYPDQDLTVLWSRVGESTNYGAIDDAASGGVDDDTSYVLGVSEGISDIYDYSKLSQVNGKVHSVEIALDATTDSGNDEQVEVIIAGTTLDAVTVPSAAYDRVPIQLDTDPASTKGWKIEDLKTVTGGVKVPGDLVGSGNLLMDVLMADLSTKQAFLNESDQLEVELATTLTGLIPTANDEIDVLMSNLSTKKIPLTNDAESPMINWGLSDPTYFPTKIGHGPKYRQIFIDEGQVGYTITIEFENPAKAGTQIVYSITGDMVNGTHYTITSGASPINVVTGSTTATITIDFPLNAVWYKERIMNLIFNEGASSNIRTNALTDEFRIHLNASNQPPPVLSFTTPTISGGLGLHNIPCEIPAGRTLEPVTVYFKQSNAGDPGAAVETVDFNFISTSGSLLLNSPSVSTVDIQIDVLLTSGKPIEIVFDHENKDGTNENSHVQTENYEYIPEGTVEVFPGDPGNIVGGSGDVRGVVYTADNTSVDHAGDPAKAFHLRAGYDANIFAYIRKSLEGQFHTDMPESYVKMERWNLFFTTVAEPDIPGFTAAEYLRLTIRDRGTSVVDEEILHGEGEQNLIADFQRTGVNTYILDSLTGIGGSPYPGTNSDAGVSVDPITGDPVLWILLHEENATRLAKAAVNILIRPVFHPSEDPSLHLTKATVMYGGYEIKDQTRIQVPPVQDLPYFWIKPDFEWGPRGNATTNPSLIQTFNINS